MARKGVEAASVAEIVREAGVSQPSFYNHFDSKEELAEEIVADFFRSDVAFKHRVFELVDDPAEAIAINARHTLHVATRDPIVAQVIVHGGTGRNLLRISDSDELADMIAEGIRLGRFAQLNPRVAALLIRGAGFPLLQEILKGNAPATVESDFAELVLRMLGVPPEEAAEIAGRPDPVLNGESEQPPEYDNTADKLRRAKS
jgi:AcrR family transcriptional regulator